MREIMLNEGETLEEGNEILVDVREDVTIDIHVNVEQIERIEPVRLRLNHHRLSSGRACEGTLIWMVGREKPIYCPATDPWDVWGEEMERPPCSAPNHIRQLTMIKGNWIDNVFPR